MTYTRSHEIKVHAQGRIVIPSELRQAMRVQDGEQLLARLEDGRLILERRMDVLHRLRSAFQASDAVAQREQDLASSAEPEHA